MELLRAVHANYRQMASDHIHHPRATGLHEVALDVLAPDAELIERSLVEPEAFRLIWKRHHDALGRYLASRVGLDSVEDLLVTTFMHAFESRSRFDASRVAGTAKPWLLGIATNVIAQHRALERRWLRHREPEIVSWSGPQSKSDAGIEAIDSRGRVAFALSTLPEAQRDAFLLAVVGELDYEEIAEAIGVPIGTVRSRISRARIHLQKSMEGDRDA